jgi:hypothetical protein
MLQSSRDRGIFGYRTFKPRQNVTILGPASFWVALLGLMQVQIENVHDNHKQKLNFKPPIPQLAKLSSCFCLRWSGCLTYMAPSLSKPFGSGHTRSMTGIDRLLHIPLLLAGSRPGTLGARESYCEIIEAMESRTRQQQGHHLTRQLRVQTELPAAYWTQARQS